MKATPVGFLALLSLLMSACTAAATATPVPTAAPTATAVPTATPTPEPLRLGSLFLDLFDHFFNGTELGSHNGPIVRSTLLAVKHVNDAGGVFGQPVEIHFRGTGFRESPTEQALWLLDNEGVHAFLGPPSSTHLAEVTETVAIPRGIPFVSQSTAPFIADLEDGGFVFRVTLSDLAQGIALADLAEDEGFDHVALVHRDTHWGIGLAETFKAHFDGEVTEVSLHPDQETFAEELHQVAVSDAPALVILTFHQQAVPVLEEVAKFGHFEEFLMPGDLRSLEFLAEFPELLDGSKGVAPYGKHVTEADGHWEADYTAEYGELDHRPYMRQSYDGAIAVMLAAEYAGSTDGAAIRDALHSIANPPGQRFPASAAGVKGALAAIRNGEDIDLDGEGTSLDWDSRGEIVVGHMGVWQFQDGEIVDLRHFDVDISQ